jgi:small GTP-binding protein
LTTIGLQNYFNSYKLSDGSLVNVNIIDTSGQERFRALNQNYYRNADCCLLVYDVSNRKSFEECKYYIQQIKERCKQNIKVILLGNKTDLKKNVSTEEGIKLALKNEYIFKETSCVKNINVINAFEALIEITNNEAKKNNTNQLKRTKSKIVLTKEGHNKSENKKVSKEEKRRIC